MRKTHIPGMYCVEKMYFDAFEDLAILIISFNSDIINSIMHEIERRNYVRC